jgi:hypothetical protein
MFLRVFFKSSIYPHRIHAVAGYAVDGNTDGEFLNSSTTSTKDEQGAWWQVDLGGKKINLNITFVSGYVFACILYVTPRILHVTPCRN